MRDNSQIDPLKYIKLPGYTSNFKGKFYNSDDLSGVLGQYQQSPDIFSGN